MNRRQRKKNIFVNVRDKTKNKRLIKKYPWLEVKCGCGSKWSTTWINGIPRGWVKRFGKQFCEDMDTELRRSGLINNYTVFQTKEKFGEMRWYDSGGNEETDNIITKYTHISHRTCVICGKFPVPVINNGWIQPLCKECFDKHWHRHSIKPYESFVVDDSEFDPVARYKQLFTNAVIEYDTSDIVRRIS